MGVSGGRAGSSRSRAVLGDVGLNVGRSLSRGQRGRHGSLPRCSFCAGNEDYVIVSVTHSTAIQKDKKEADLLYSNCQGELVGTVVAKHVYAAPGSPRRGSIKVLAVCSS